MVVISDTSVISNLLQVQQIHLLPLLYQKIIIPSAVYDELSFIANQKEFIDQQSWISIATPNETSVIPLLNFLDKGELFTKQELQELLTSQDAKLNFEYCLDLLLWFGFIGVAKSDHERVYIYSVEYDQRRLEAIANNMGQDVLYCVNPAFLEGLN